MDFSLVPLAHKPELIDQCIDLLNEEWPRSQKARIVGLKRLLCTSPPMAYVFIENGSGELVGHLRLSPLGMGSARECWIESVVIRKGMRGQGIGRKMMEMVETEARKHGFDKICCSTTDKIDFYRCCGYKESDRPIQNCGSSAPLLERFGLTPLLRNIKQNDELSNKQTGTTTPTECQAKKQSDPAKNVPVPPAPPLSFSEPHKITKKTFVFKHLE
ncbi:hypothetical protein niasHT_030658 [Heterodera trifolii]|uniref:N-acetyltransferase domain-containing protein n=1 Tax=Heterodera trifolii TaxID=157864 RepID=A0ABD2HQE6_9BILA